MKDIVASVTAPFRLIGWLIILALLGGSDQPPKRDHHAPADHHQVSADRRRGH